MKTNVVIASQGDRIRLSKIDPEDTGGASMKKACKLFVDLREEISLLQEKLFAGHERSLLILFQAMDTGGDDRLTLINASAPSSGCGWRLKLGYISRQSVQTPIEQSRT